MTEQHPLTDEMCEEIQMKLHAGPDHWYYEDMRVAYDKGGDDMLGRVIEWLNDNVGMLILDTESEFGARYLESLEKEFIQNFKKAMRPQEEN